MSDSSPHAASIGRNGWAPFGAEYAMLPRWNRFQQWYIQTFGIVDLPSRLRARLLFRELRRMHSNAVLDLGSGTGSYSFCLSRNAGTQVYALDTDQRRVSDCLHIAQKLKRENVRFCAGSADFDLRRVASQSIELVLAIEVLQYCKSVDAVFHEVCRVLKPGGYLVAHVPALGYLRPSETILFNHENLRQFTQGAGLQCCSLASTFAGGHRRLCRFYEIISASQWLTALLFPLLMVVSLLFSGRTSSGDYLFLIARKPELKCG
jgi:SAM-dependent methyltransferase